MTESKIITNLYNNFIFTDDLVIPPEFGGTIPKSELNKNDVLSGRGGCVNAYPGNIQFRALVGQPKIREIYNQSKRKEKARIAKKIVQMIRSMNPPGRFLEEDKSSDIGWIEIGDNKAMEKVKQAMREMRRNSLKKQKKKQTPDHGRSLKKDKTSAAAAATVATTTTTTPQVVPSSNCLSSSLDGGNTKSQEQENVPLVPLSSTLSNCSSFTSQSSPPHSNKPKDNESCAKTPNELQQQVQQQEDPFPLIPLPSLSSNISPPPAPESYLNQCNELNDEQYGNNTSDDETATPPPSPTICNENHNYNEQVNSPKKEQEKPQVQLSSSLVSNNTSSTTPPLPPLVPQTFVEQSNNEPHEEFDRRTYTIHQRKMEQSCSNFDIPPINDGTHNQITKENAFSNHNEEFDKRRYSFHHRKLEESCTNFETPQNSNNANKKMDISQEIILEGLMKDTLYSDTLYSLSMMDIGDSNDKLLQNSNGGTNEEMNKSPSEHFVSSYF